MKATRLSVSIVLLAASCLSFANAESEPVRAWEEKISIPTYEAGPPELNPMFYFGRPSQGAEGRVYPYPLYDSLTHKKVDKTYTAVYLENEYIRIGVLPEIGGRIFEGIDKTNGYNFIYRQHVIKPQLIGLIGAWISGGVEWNIPHHHRASTFIPVQHRLVDNGDGSKTIWVGELEIRHRMRWAVGYTLRPGKAYLEASVRILNRTPVVNTMLCFANVAVHTNENYQVIFPPGTQFGTHHHKREFINWPIATTTYGGADFSAGVDVSWYKNHQDANSIFAWNYEDDFFAGYDHGKQAGIMSVADHNIVPGKKVWTWGNGPRGRMWDRLLTDDDGPYIELMVGAYSDNQPDYSFLQPYETRSFEMYWYPFKSIGGAKKANLEAAVNLEVDKERNAKLGFYTTSEHAAARVRLVAGERTLLEQTIAIGPTKPFLTQVTLPDGVEDEDLTASISVEDRDLISYSPQRIEPKPMPAPVKPPLTPEEIKTTEELYLTGLRVEQFHSPTHDPEPYWEEALRRDPGDTRVNTALGINYLKKARFNDAEKLFRKAIERSTDKYTSPKDGEAFYYLGVALKAQGKQDEAFTWFYKSTWSAAWRAAGYYSLAEVASMRGDTKQALGFANESLESNALNIRALTLKAAALRRIGRREEASKTLTAASGLANPLDARLIAEAWLCSTNPSALESLLEEATRHPQIAQELAAEYKNCGLWEDGAAVLEALRGVRGFSPLVHYYLAYFQTRLGQTEKAAESYRTAAAMSPHYVFPFQWEAIEVLKAAIQANPKDARAPYYLGNLLFDWQPAEAVKYWEQSAALDADFAIVHRNLALAYAHQEGGFEKAIASLEKATSLDRKYAIHFGELDELYAAAGAPVEKRLAILEKNQEIIAQRDESLSRAIALKVFAGKYDEAIGLMTGRMFAVWEGGSLTVASSWTDAHLGRGRARLAKGQAREALVDFEAAGRVPENLPSESVGEAHRTAERYYWIGVAHEKLGDAGQAKAFWEKSALPESQGARRRPGERVTADGQQYYQAMSLLKLGKTEEANAIFKSLVQSSAEALSANPLEGVAVSLDERSRERSRLAHAHYIGGLGYAGLGDAEKARQEFTQALETSPDLLGASWMLAEKGK